MILSRPARFVIPAAAFALAFLIAAIGPGSVEAQQQKKKPSRRSRHPMWTRNRCSSRSRGRSGPTCRRASCRWSSSRASGSRWSATRTAERMNLFGHFETLLHLRFPDKELVVRNFARPGGRGRRSASGRPTTRKLDDPLYAFGAGHVPLLLRLQRVVRGAGRGRAVQGGLREVPRRVRARSTRATTPKSPPRFVLVSPIAFEPTGDPFLPDGKKENANLKLYADAVKAVAEKRKLAFVDLFTRPRRSFAEEPGMQFTINGCHLNEAGDQVGRPDCSTPACSAAPAADPDTARVREAAGRGQRQVVGPPAGLPHAQRLVRLRRPAHLRHRDVPARVR